MKLFEQLFLTHDFFSWYAYLTQIEDETLAYVTTKIFFYTWKKNRTVFLTFKAKPKGCTYQLRKTISFWKSTSHSCNGLCCTLATYVPLLKQAAGYSVIKPQAREIIQDTQVVSLRCC